MFSLKSPISTPALLTACFCIFLTAPVDAKTCKNPDNETSVQGGRHCLVISTTKAAENTERLVVVLHGDQSKGGPVDYIFRFAANFADSTTTAVGMARPGYPAAGTKSSGQATRSQNRDSKYGKREIESIGVAIEQLKNHHQANQVILVGHSGGALISGVLLGLRPDLVDGVILISCPCNMPKWRAMHHRSPMLRAQSPHKWLKKARTDARIVAVTGARDGNTAPRLAAKYVESARELGLEAEFLKISNAKHSLSKTLRTAVLEAYFEYFD